MKLLTIACTLALTSVGVAHAQEFTVIDETGILDSSTLSLTSLDLGHPGYQLETVQGELSVPTPVELSPYEALDIFFTLSEPLDLSGYINTSPYSTTGSPYDRIAEPGGDLVSSAWGFPCHFEAADVLGCGLLTLAYFASGVTGTAPIEIGGDVPLQLDFVPEPAVWAMMLIGVGASGAQLRSRRSQLRA